MSKICQDRVVIVTGAGRGIGRAHALEFARQGAKVVVNDLGAEADGVGSSAGPANEVADEIRAMGGEAIVNGADVADFEASRELVKSAVDTFGRLDVVVNNAGFLRDRMFLKISEDEWDAVINVHLKGTFAPAHHAAQYWREQSKAGNTIDARLINTTSVSGIYGNPGQTNYGAAKAGIAAFSVISARELARYGVTVNCIAPGALTRLTEDLQPGEITDEMREAQSPRWIAPIVTWLVSRESSDVTGRVFEASGGVLAVAEGWNRGPTVKPVQDPTVLGPIVREMVGEAQLNTGMNGAPLDGGLGS